ncbi:MAG TPA: hypothetical protein DCW29_02635 [Janthinobacterium sp.]|nr:hypothetical protein [Janthinobacterium sp.]
MLLRQHTCLTLLALAAGLLGGAARADQAVQTADKPLWSFSGFGSVGVVHADDDQADFTSNVLKANGAGHSHSWSASVDSRIGAQLDLNLNKQWSAVLQMISEQALDNSYRPIVEWANIKYQVTPELSVRLGRIALPMFLAADYRKVGYAYPWVRTPVEVYGAIPISNSDGIDASYHWSSGAVKHVTQVFYGGSDIKLSGTARAEARGLAGVSDSADYGALSLRANVLSTNLTVDLARPLFDAFQRFGARGDAIAAQYDVNHKRALGVSVGFNYDPGNWFLMGELGRLNAKSFLGDKTAMYASAGYRYRGFTPYLAYARVKSNGPTSDPGLSLAGLPPQLAGAAAALNANLNGLLSTVAIQTTVSAGARWDVRENMALKLQVDRVLPRDGSSGTLINVQPGFRSGQAVNVASVVLDFVF